MDEDLENIETWAELEGSILQKFMNEVFSSEITVNYSEELEWCSHALYAEYRGWS